MNLSEISPYYESIHHQKDIWYVFQRAVKQQKDYYLYLNKVLTSKWLLDWSGSIIYNCMWPDRSIPELLFWKRRIVGFDIAWLWKALEWFDADIIKKVYETYNSKGDSDIDSVIFNDFNVTDNKDSYLWYKSTDLRYWTNSVLLTKELINDWLELDDLEILNDEKYWLKRLSIESKSWKMWWIEIYQCNVLKKKYKEAIYSVLEDVDPLIYLEKSAQKVTGKLSYPLKFALKSENVEIVALWWDCSKGADFRKSEKKVSRVGAIFPNKLKDIQKWEDKLPLIKDSLDLYTFDQNLSTKYLSRFALIPDKINPYARDLDIYHK